ncbi:hypothetical protein [Amycolatopsis saalfeldensis]|uniref:Uncharacterized protein n=1 Tax=Amycolatopsis saalfeldensis TaxID=394193 RepID=A0A1H8XG91_9PSEU|nr:hypothetical protein [Amycolatopsis saalfeldensis]SEP38889.1 hypothetical protein SAMN04489732_107198 [Amycolatopsis saalfeldensis]
MTDLVFDAVSVRTEDAVLDRVAPVRRVDPDGTPLSMPVKETVTTGGGE